MVSLSLQTGAGKNCGVGPQKTRRVIKFLSFAVDHQPVGMVGQGSHGPLQAAWGVEIVGIEPTNQAAAGTGGGLVECICWACIPAGHEAQPVITMAPLFNLLKAAIGGASIGEQYFKNFRLCQRRGNGFVKKWPCIETGHQHRNLRVQRPVACSLIMRPSRFIALACSCACAWVSSSPARERRK
nr:hypothetical protein [Synechococcus sp. BA-124 BA4]